MEPYRPGFAFSHVPTPSAIAKAWRHIYPSTNGHSNEGRAMGEPATDRCSEVSFGRPGIPPLTTPRV